MQHNNIELLEAYLQVSIHLPPSKFKTIRHLFQKETFRKGIYLVKQNGFSDKMFFLVDGYIRCYANKKNKEITHWVYWKNRLVTDIPSFKRQRPALWHFQTLSDCIVFSLTYENYQQIKHILPDWDTYENLILTKFFIALEHRIYTFISMNATERYQFLYEAYPEIFNQIPLIYLASLLNMTPETLSRIRRKAIS